MTIDYGYGWGPHDLNKPWWEIPSNPLNPSPSETIRTITTNTVNISFSNVFEDDLGDILQEVKELLLEKNRKYGDSALNPSRILSKSDPAEQIKVRIDDKLTRLRNQQSDEDEDVVKDLIGYLILLRIAQKRAEKSEIGGTIHKLNTSVIGNDPSKA